MLAAHECRRRQITVTPTLVQHAVEWEGDQWTGYHISISMITGTALVLRLNSEIIFSAIRN